MNPEERQKLEQHFQSQAATIAALQAELAEIKKTQNPLSNEERQILDELLRNQAASVSSLQAELTELKNLQGSSSNSKQSKEPKEPKLAPPETFKGDRKQSTNFLLQLQNNFDGQPTRFETDGQKVAYAISHLQGDAFNWVKPLLKENKPEVRTYSAFKDAFEKAFNDIDLRKRAENRIFNLKQGKRAASTMVAEFRTLAYEANLDESVLFHAFYQALNEDVKDELSKIERPDTIQKYYDKAIAIDDRLFERRLEKAFKQVPIPSLTRHRNGPRRQVQFDRSTYGFQNVHRAPPFGPSNQGGRNQEGQAPATEPTPMVIDALESRHRQPLSQEERKRRQDNNLCLYCGSDTHLLKNCPLKPKHRAGKVAGRS